jgi:hypothetical protein
MTTKTRSSRRWQILIRRKERNKNRIIYTKISNCLDPEEAWSTVFSKWLEKHRDYTIVRIGKKGLIVKDVDGKVFELLVDYKKLDSVH